MKDFLVAGNWKMHLSPSQAEKLTEEIIERFPKHKARTKAKRCEVLLCPPYLAIERVQKTLRRAACNIQVGAQDLHWEEQSARTGKISADMLQDLSLQYAIIGHSEQRKYFHETDETVNKKVGAALRHAISPIVCIGESLEEREQGLWRDKIAKQVTLALEGIEPAKVSQIVLAYEPIWAIGTGHSASLAEAHEAHAFLRNIISKTYGPSLAEELRILYGGSIKEENAGALFACQDIDGGLIGGAALHAAAFCKIINSAP